MSDLISRDALKETWCANCDNKHLCGDKARCDEVKELYDMPTIEAEPTFEQIEEYCRKRCLVVVDGALFNEMKSRWSAEPKWIPVTERLPEEYEEVNITWVNTDPERYYADIKGVPFVGSAIYCKGRWYWYSATCKDYLEEYGFAQGDEMDDAIKVIAWTPLPKPYKMDEVEK